MSASHELVLLPDRLAVCRLAGDDELPFWATQAGFCSFTRSADELSIVCGEFYVPEPMKADRGWRALRLAGVFDLSAVGILSSLSTPLAEAGISVFAVSTFDTDYLLVKECNLARAIDVLKASGHSVHAPT
jgi:hypothetical protein